MSNETSQQYLDKMANQLSEHFDSVLILASRVVPDGGTVNHTSGSGNFYARVGMAKAFMDTEEARTKRWLDKQDE